MSKVSQKPISLPMRKRLRPTVNLNVAGRRRKDVKETPTDGTGEACSGINTTSSQDVKSQEIVETPLKQDNKNTGAYDGIINREGAKVLNKSFESERSVSSSVSTVLLQNETQTPNRESEEHNRKLLNNSFESVASISSSVSTVVLQNGQHVPTIHSDNDIGQKSALTVKPGHESRKSIASDTSNCMGENDIRVTASLTENGNARIECFDSRSNSQETDADIELSESVAIDTVTVPHKEKDNARYASVGRSKKSETSNKSGALFHNDVSTDSESVCEDDQSIISDRSHSRDGARFLPLVKPHRKVGSMAKRVSDARRQFEARFADKKPERGALRMLDLIYYNPATNPMKSTPDNSSKEVTVGPAVDETDSRQEEEEEEEEEDVDNPAEENVQEEDNDSRIPAPRVKIGPNGEIILDEQSLVIETTQSKKSRQEIANLTVVVDTGSNTTYHTYSKKKRSRSEWSIDETIRFYKALQTLGTDFSLMQTLFPARSRLDLKAKFKKEERINGHLIEKALRFPSLFDLSELEKEQIIAEEKKKNSKEKRQKHKQGSKPRKRSLKSLGFDDDDRGPDTNTKKRKQDRTLPEKNHSKDTSKGNAEVSQANCSSDEEYVPPAREEKNINDIISEGNERLSGRTRRGTGAKTREYVSLEDKDDFLEAGVDLLEASEDEEPPGEEGAQEEEEEENNQTVAENEPCLQNTPNPFEGFSVDNVEPGSLVLVTTQHPDNPGYHICNVFMVQERANSGQNNVNYQNTDGLCVPSGDAESVAVEPDVETEPS